MLPTIVEIPTGTGSEYSTGSYIQTQTGVYILIESSGSLVIPESTMIGAISTGSTLSNTGISLSGGTLPVENPTLNLPSVTPIVPQIFDTTILQEKVLRIYDVDANGKIDRLEVEYTGTLSGSLHPEKFILYSGTG